MYLKEYFPSQFYSKYIDSYFTIDSALINEDVKDLIIPDGTFGLLFLSEDNISRSISTTTDPKQMKRSTIFGQRTKPVNYCFTKGSMTAFGVKINPCGFHLFTNIARKDFKDSFVEIDLLENASLLNLENKILSCEKVSCKIEIIESHIQNELNRNILDRDHLLFECIINHIYSKKGEIRFFQLTEYFNLNYKKVERLFNKYLGISPKTYIRIVRFNASIHNFNKLEHKNLTHLGLDLGFFDQSHFIKEFKCFTSLTPKNYFNKQKSESEKVYMKIINERW